MRPPDKSCDDLARWHRAIQAILQELGSRTPTELVKILEPNSDKHHEELSKIRRQELFAQYMSDRLGIEFKYTTPIDLYPKFYVQIMIGLYDSHVRLEVYMPRSVAEFIKHEGALREDSKRKFVLSGSEAKLFEAGCRALGKDPSVEWDRIKAEILGDEDTHAAIFSHEGKLHDHGLYIDELTKLTEEAS